jgi:hypothetical protein
MPKALPRNLLEKRRKVTEKTSLKRAGVPPRLEILWAWANLPLFTVLILYYAYFIRHSKFVLVNISINIVIFNRSFVGRTSATVH